MLDLKLIDNYYPHFHNFIDVNKTYFIDKTYIKLTIWLEIWGKVMDCTQINQVDVRRLKKSEANKEISEIEKYSSKDSDMHVNEELFNTFFKLYEVDKSLHITTYLRTLISYINIKSLRNIKKYIQQNMLILCFIVGLR